MTCGVKQGDPLSPLLFSLVIDELLDQLEECGGGFSFTDEHKLNCLAFADDILLLSNSKAGLQILLLHSYRFFTRRHLRLNTEKCLTLRLYRVPKTRSVCVDVLSQFYLDPSEPCTCIPRFTISEYLSYLGVDFNPYGKRRDMLRRVESMLQSVARAELKPQQKIQLIRAHLIPYLMYSFCNSNPAAGTAASADRLIRQKIKAILHLPQSTMSDHFFYLPMKEGGLGLQSLSEAVDFTMLNLYRKLAESRYPAVRAAAGLWFNIHRHSKLAQRRSISDFTERGIRNAGMAILEYHRARFTATYQGSGHHEFAEACSNLWIDGERMTGRSYIASRFMVTVEPTLRHDDQVFKPDLIAVKGGKAWALDVVIPFESNDTLARRHAEKCRKCACLAEPVLKLTGANVYTTGSIVIGARGAWCPKNEGTLKEMEWALSEPTKALLCIMTLERTNQLVSWFMRTTENLAFHAVSRTRRHEGQERSTPAPSMRPSTLGSHAH
uniref:Reverse transcriptase domain-containing protein n=1 Tax=Trichuris muris TaxID=70415 RepID=A0A5S6QG21_TRIMR